MEDRALVEATLCGNRDAFALLVRKYQATLVASAYHLIQQRDDAEDLAQEAFVEAYRRLGALREWDKFAGWLFTILRSKCLRHLERRRQDYSLEDYGELPAAPAPVDDGVLADALQRLPLADREVLAARYLHDLAFDEVAGVLGIGSDAARMRCTRARERLRHLLEEVDEERTRQLMRRAMGIWFIGRSGDALTHRILQQVHHMPIPPLRHFTPHGYTGQSLWSGLATQAVLQKIVAGSLVLVLLVGSVSLTSRSSVKGPEGALARLVATSHPLTAQKKMTDPAEHAPLPDSSWVIDANHPVRIYVADTGDNRVVQFDDMRGTHWTALGSTGSGINLFNSPDDIVVRPDGKIYVADDLNYRIVRVNDMTGAGWTAIGSFGRGVCQFEGTMSIAVGSGEKIYAVDSGNNRVVCMNDMTGKNWTTFGKMGLAGVGRFYLPQGITVGPDGKIYVLDGLKELLVCMNDMTGAGWTSIGDGFSFLNHGADRIGTPTGITIGPDKKIYLADPDNNRIVRMDDMTGKNLTTLGGRPGNGVKQFSQPWRIAFGPDGRIYVADMGNNRIVRMDNMAGTNWTTYQGNSNGNGYFSRPKGIAVR